MKERIRELIREYAEECLEDYEIRLENYQKEKIELELNSQLEVVINDMIDDVLNEELEAIASDVIDEEI